MFELIEYLKTFNHLDITNRDKILGENDLEKIIQGRVIEKNNDNKRNSVSSILVVSPHTWDNSTQKTALEYSRDFSWMGHFNRNNCSEIVVSKDDGYYSYLFGNTDFGGNTIVVSRNQRMWSGKGHFDSQKFTHIVPLVTNVSYQGIYDIIRKNYIDAKKIIK